MRSRSPALCQFTSTALGGFDLSHTMERRASREPALSEAEGSAGRGRPALHQEAEKTSCSAGSEAHGEFHGHQRRQQRQHDPARRNLQIPLQSRPEDGR
jgi:hypothetical protein